MKKIVFTLVALTFFLVSCKKNSDKKENSEAETAQIESQKAAEPFFKLSLAQWSFNRAIRGGEMSPFDFAKKAKELDFEGIEYVSQLYTKEIEKVGMDSVVSRMKSESEKYGVTNVLIMIDREGDLAAEDEKDRDAAVENHKKWVDAAATLGCHSVRVNLFGTNDEATWLKTAPDGLKKLSDYAATKNISVIVENHGYLSSNAGLLMQVMNAVAMDNCGTLPDFGNFCLKREGGAQWDAKCVEEYDRYKGVEEMMPKAFAVSAKSHEFNAEGNETATDYVKMMKIVKDAGYNGFVGVEYEGQTLAEEAGIIATRDLLLKVAKEL
ncbi:sugar phosphate isomerase/epimerase family protein [Spongiivirga citrea]|uniref:TIM barrel protein n=1 Tax=Spongiivirga citrea TaxID=1481457 RepID=A0A6M0CME5_9FLAO|nr:sugar phosphate isomerase/epimerase family protein [Spongiivirga citrea]NER17184.1 TIM barrel protein [Spongiivirga citrea]